MFVVVSLHVVLLCAVRLFVPLSNCQAVGKSWDERSRVTLYTTMFPSGPGSAAVRPSLHKGKLAERPHGVIHKPESLPSTVSMYI